MTIKELVSALRISSEAAKMTNSITWATLMETAAFAIESLQNDFDRAMDYVKKWEVIANETKDLLLKEHEKVPKWIPVKERLPEKRKYVLVRYKNNDMAVACWFDGDEDILFWRAMTDEGWCADCDTDPTHWMPLPEPPKEVSE